MSLYLVHTKTGRKYKVVGRDQEAGTITLKGELAEFTEPFDKERLKALGYTLQKGDAA